MDTYIDRMINEVSELDTRIEKLTEFTHGPIFATLNMRKQDAMQNQLKAMELYRHFLGERIHMETHVNTIEGALRMHPDLVDGERN